MLLTASCPSSRETATASVETGWRIRPPNSATTVAVGTVHELDGLPDELTPVVLTPTLTAPTSTTPILTVGADEHLAALAGWGGRVLVKLASPMRRFGRDTTLIDRALASGLDVVGVSVPPTTGRALAPNMAQ